jgi:putative membrane protein
VRKVLIIGALLGLLLACGLIAYHGVGTVARAFVSTGWGLAAVVAFHALPLVLGGLGWWTVIDPPRPGLPVLIRLRWIREAVNTLLPVAQIGGDIVGARLLTGHGVRANDAGASVVVNKTIEVLSLFAYTLAGLGLLLLLKGQGSLAGWIGIGLLIAAPVLIGFMIAQRLGLFKLVERLLLAIGDRARWLAIGDIAGLHERILATYRRRRAIAICFVWELLAWAAGAGEIWLALYFMGYPVGLAEAVVLESLGQAVRSAAFPIPAALGVQEGSYLVLGGFFGLTPEVALALSLVKRARHLGAGLPGLIAWQVAEGHRFVLRRKESQG